MEEIWKKIEWKGVSLYVSTLGRVKDSKGRIKTPNKTFKYDRICVGRSWALIHRLVATAFIPNPNGLETVNHIDGNKRNMCCAGRRKTDGGFCWKRTRIS